MSRNASNHCLPHVVVKKGQQKVQYRASGNKRQITFVGCVNVAESAFPPFVIFNAMSLNMEWRFQVPRMA